MPGYCVVNEICIENKGKLRFSHMIAVLKSDCFLVSREGRVTGCYNNTISLLSNKR